MLSRLISSAIALAIGVTTAQAAAGTPYALQQSEIATIKQTIAQAMPEPASASFEGIAAVRTTRGQIVVCGFFNGKNSLGGYAGLTPFIGVLTDTFSIGNYGGSNEENVAVAHACRSNGIDI